MATCPTCHQEIAPTLSMEEYNARAIPRLASIDALTKKIQDGNLSWDYSPEGQLWKRLMADQNADEVAAGL